MSGAVVQRPGVAVRQLSGPWCALFSGNGNSLRMQSISAFSNENDHVVAFETIEERQRA
jgi:hypothetical protein